MWSLPYGVLRVVLPGPQYLGMTEWEKQRERTEFAKAADVYQPLATSLESKFTRGETAVEDEKKQVRATMLLLHCML